MSGYEKAKYATGLRLAHVLDRLAKTGCEPMQESPHVWPDKRWWHELLTITAVCPDCRKGRTLRVRVNERGQVRTFCSDANCKGHIRAAVVAFGHNGSVEVRP